MFPARNVKKGFHLQCSELCQSNIKATDVSTNADTVTTRISVGLKDTNQSAGKMWKTRPARLVISTHLSMSTANIKTTQLCVDLQEAAIMSMDRI